MPKTLAKVRPLPQPLRTFSPAPGQAADLALKTNLSSSYAEIPRLRDWIGHLAEYAGMAPADLFDLRLAAIETFFHVIEEAYDGEDTGVVKATLLLRGDEVRLVLRDYGRKLTGFTAGMERIPDAEGTQLFLIRRLVDEVKFHTSLPRGTAVEIMKRLAPSPGRKDPPSPAAKVQPRSSPRATTSRRRTGSHKRPASE
jgi:anti-sigma regulatory factor (Ser/Thr protein kinase)